jgi:hypothetical protein
MKDKLRKRVREERQSWEQYDTDLEGLWNNIEDQLEKNVQKGPHFYKIWMKIAASIALIIGVGWGTLSILGGRNEDQLYALKDISPELAETEYYYANRISEQLQLINTSSADVNGIIEEDLALLDEAYKELQQDLKDNADSEEVINAMIENYRIKLQILEKVLEKVRTNEKKETAHEIII